MAEGDTVLLDMGSEYSGYATDTTRSYPVNGVFTPDQRALYVSYSLSLSLSLTHTHTLIHSLSLFVNGVHLDPRAPPMLSIVSFASVANHPLDLFSALLWALYG